MVREQIAEAYYKAMGRKNVSDAAQYIHPDIEFIAPLAKTKGKEAFLEAASKFVNLFNTLKIDLTFEDEERAVVIYTLDCPLPIGNFRAAALLSFENELISRIELFYDASPFKK